MRSYKMKILCKGCEGKGYIDPPYGDSSAAAAIVCPCCGGSGTQDVAVAED